MKTADYDDSAPKGWVPIAAVVLLLAAAGGVYIGAVRSLGAHDLPSDTETLAAMPNVANVKPLADTAADDARLRALVHEEVTAALKSAKPTAPKPTAPKADDDDNSDSAAAATASLNAAAAGRTTTPAASSSTSASPLN